MASSGDWQSILTGNFGSGPTGAGGSWVVDQLNALNPNYDWYPSVSSQYQNAVNTYGGWYDTGRSPQSAVLSDILQNAVSKDPANASWLSAGKPSTEQMQNETNSIQNYQANDSPTSRKSGGLGGLGTILGLVGLAYGGYSLLAAGGAFGATAATTLSGGAGFGAAGELLGGAESLSGAAAGTVAAGGAAATGGLTASSIFSGLKTAATILSPIASLMQVAAGVNAAKGSGITNSTSSPIVAPPVTMPTGGGPDTLNAMRGSVQEQVMRRGRAATVLTSPSEGTRLGS